MTERKIFEKIISGGQTGADQGALDAALAINHPCGGWCPQGRKSEDGPITDMYPVQELDLDRYVSRTEQNVIDSDGTLIFFYGEPEGGTALTVNLARQYDKPLYLFDLDNHALNQDPEVIWEWGLENNVYVLNVAGPRESKHPGTQVLVKALMMRLLEHARKCYSVIEEKK